MKIIQINSTISSGSTGRIAYQIHKYLDENHIDNRIVHGYGSTEEPFSFSLNSYWETHLHSMFSRKLCAQGRCSQFQTLRLIKYLNTEKPDVIHLHNIHGHYLNYPMLFRYIQRKHIPVVWTLHDCWSFTGKCAHYTAIGCDKWKTECYECPNLATYPDSTFDASRKNFRLKKDLFTSLDQLYIVCNSNWLCSQVEQSFLKNKEITRIYNGIDTNCFQPCDPKMVMKKYAIVRKENRYLILGVSSVWKKEKGWDTMLNLAEALGDRGQLVLVGLTAEQMNNLPEHITGIIRTDNTAELAALYSMADVLINPSEEETFGLVPCEAMACGTPVIVSTETACPEIVDDSTGRVVHMQDISEIKHAIEQICCVDKSFYRDKCVNKVKSFYSVQSMCQQYGTLYKKIKNGEQQQC